MLHSLTELHLTPQFLIQLQPGPKYRVSNGHGKSPSGHLLPFFSYFYSLSTAGPSHAPPVKAGCLVTEMLMYK
jgi:hypothetical protein